MIVCTLFAELRRRDTRAGTTTNVPIVLNKQNTLYLNHATAKKMFAENKKIQYCQKIPSIIPVTWNPEYPLGRFSKAKRS